MIFLIGMPGVGKTYWAEKIADAYGWEYYDLDQFIEQGEASSISAIFEHYGETAFRKKEHQYLAMLIDSEPVNTIIACGGGTPCFHQNLEMMKQAGTVVYLQAGITHLLHNLKSETGTRPLLSTRDDLEGYLTGLLKDRSACYEQAHYILQSENISLTNFDQIIN